MVDSVRNSPNVGNLAAHDQKSNLSSGQSSQVAEFDAVKLILRCKRGFIYMRKSAH